MWNNRILKRTDTMGREFYQICEVFYDPDGKPNGYAPIDDLVGDTEKDVRGLVGYICKDLKRKELTTLNETDFG